jgi:multidrug efflux pump subunit AcrA (membrane-fusion protein)
VFKFGEKFIEHLKELVLAAQASLSAAEAQVRDAYSDMTAQYGSVAAGLQARHQELSQRWEAAKKQVVYCKQKLSAAKNADRTQWAVHNALKNILSKYNITRQQYHNGAMNGVHCVRFLQHWPQIQADIRELFTRPLRRSDGAPDAEIDRFLSAIGEAADVLYLVRYYRTPTALLS